MDHRPETASGHLVRTRPIAHTAECGFASGVWVRIETTDQAITAFGGVELPREAARAGGSARPAGMGYRARVAGALVQPERVACGRVP